MQRTDGHTKVDNMKIAVPDLVSNSYFPALAALQLGYFEDEGLDLQLEHIFPINKSCEALRDGEVDFVAGSAHAPLAAFPNWQGAKLLAALAQGMYWLLVVNRGSHSASRPRMRWPTVKSTPSGPTAWVRKPP
jgi:hypothetical protein